MKEYKINGSKYTEVCPTMEEFVKQLCPNISDEKLNHWLDIMKIMMKVKSQPMIGFGKSLTTPKALVYNWYKDGFITKEDADKLIAEMEK